MASPQEGKARKRRQSATTNMIVKEGFLCKKGGVIKSWSRRYFILNYQCLCYFKRALNEADTDLQPMGRVFLSDIVNIETDGVEKKKAFVFALHTKKRAVLLQASNHEDKEKWIEAVKQALETDRKAEREDPFRRTLRRLKPGLKRITLVKDPMKGIGCTIKCAAGHVLVNRILEDGPIAHTGVLRPGDEILDIHGTTVTGMQVEEVVEIIKKVPDQFLATVRPITSITKDKPVDTGSVLYSEIRPLSPSVVVSTATKRPFSIPDILISQETPVPPTFDSSPAPSLDDVGYYGDEEEGDMPPPLPPRTEDALIILDPPPPQANGHEFKPVLPPKPREDLKLDKNGLHFPSRPRMQKSKSEDAIARVAVEEGTKKNREPRPHIYEEIPPHLNYMDIRRLEFTSGQNVKSKTGSLVKVELDWKRKVRV